jgi:DNA-binding response OmpR family regulator
MPQVLIVDDEKNILKTLSIGLCRYNYLVKQATNGLEALSILRKNPCDFVVSDIRMIPMDGYTLAAKIKKKYPEIRIILMSAFDPENHNSRLNTNTHYPLLTKPFSISDLVAKLLVEDKQNLDN